MVILFLSLTSVCKDVKLSNTSRSVPLPFWRKWYFLSWKVACSCSSQWWYSINICTCFSCLESVRFILSLNLGGSYGSVCQLPFCMKAQNLQNRLCFDIHCFSDMKWYAMICNGKYAYSTALVCTMLHKQSKSDMCVCVCVCVRACVCACVCEREREREGITVQLKLRKCHQAQHQQHHFT